VLYGCCNCDDQRGGSTTTGFALILYHIRPKNGVQFKKACSSGLRPWIKMNSRGSPVAAVPAGVMTMSTTYQSIVEMRQQHRRGD
jgi:hypothetical protein